MSAFPPTRRSTGQHPSALKSVGWILLIAGWGAACSVAPETYAADEERGSTQVVVAIARQENLEGSTRADALAGFIRLPADADRAVALDLAGLGVHLPEVGHCWQGEHERSIPALDEVAAIEFLEAGRVRLVADEGPAHELAPHAFPSVAGFLSGVLYASRERSGDRLPAGQRYRLEAEGGAVGTLALEQAAPKVLGDVALDGAPLESVERLRAGQPLDFIWTGSDDPTDRVYVEVTSRESATSQLCTFEDAAGVGTMPPASFVEGASARVALHRLRIARALSQGTHVDQVELRFDFSIGRNVTFE